MAHGINPIIKRETDINNKVCLTDHHLHHHHHHQHQQHPTEHIMLGANSGASHPSTVTKMGSRRIFTPQFKLQVLDSYRNDSDCKGNQRATARKYGIHRRQIQKWLQCETNLRSTVSSGNNDCNSTSGNKIGASEVKSNGQNQHHITSTTTTTITSATTTNGNQQQQQQPHLSNNTNSVAQESLDKVSRHSVELCNKPNNGFLSPVRSHLLEYTTPVAYESQQQQQHVVQSPSASLPSCSPVFTSLVGNVGGSNNLNGANAVIPYDLRDYYPHYLVTPSPHHQLQYAHHDDLMSTTTLHPPHYMDIGTTPQAVYTTYGYEMPSVIVAPSATPPPSAMDLSMHGRQRDVNCERKQITQMPATWHVPQRTQNPAANSLRVSPVTTTDENAWDLSARKRKCDGSGDTKTGATPPKVVKLFKPYLLSDDDDDFDVVANEENKKFTKHRQQHDPIIWSNYTTSLSSPTSYDPSNYTSSSMSCSPPITDLNNNNLAINSGRCSTSLPSPHYDAAYHPMASYGSPVSGYDTASSYSSSSECGDSMPPRNTRYAVELKILAIDSYYNDQMCRGNEEAVADKYSVHRRQVQQWLMQEDHLRHQ